MPSKHFVVEVSIKEVTPAVKPGTPGSGRISAETKEREVDEVVKVITRASNKADACRKAHNVLDLEMGDDDGE